MISRWKRREHLPARPLSTQAIALCALVILVSGATAFIVLWWRYSGAGPGVELDVVRTAGALMAGAGGAVALLLAARRQRSTEQTLEHQREVAAATERDATEQRITELYTRAVDQLGAEKAPVRLGGLHALERRRQELQVRLTAQRILAAHLRPGQPAVFWPKIGLDLTGAHLQQLDLNACHIRSAHFDGATFAGDAMFVETTFDGYTGFLAATFTGSAGFMGATFGNAWFKGVTFARNAVFHEATFTGDAVFREATFAGPTTFDEVEFTEDPEFDGARVAQSSLDINLDKLAKLGGKGLPGVQEPPHSRDVVLPSGWITRAAQPEKGEEKNWLYVVHGPGFERQHTEATE